MSVLQYFKNTPGRPLIGRQAHSVIFFFKFATRSLEKKKGACRPLGGRQGPLPFYKPWPPYAAIPFVI